MTKVEAIEKMRSVIRRKHLALSTEETYCGWLSRFVAYLRATHPTGTSESKLERFLSGLARRHVSASTQNQAFNAVLFFYNQVLNQPLGKVDALRAKRPAHIRIAPTVEAVRSLLANVPDLHGYPVRLVVQLLYGCGLRVTEPLNLRIKDVLLGDSRLVIRGAKGGKDRVVTIPCSLAIPIKDQIRQARAVWERDQRDHVPVPLPGLLARKYPQSRFSWEWAWLFPAKSTCRDPRTSEIVRWRMHEANVQRAVKFAAARCGTAMTPHLLRHAYATHVMRRGANPRDIQAALGHSQLETTMTYLSTGETSIPSPIDQL